MRWATSSYAAPAYCFYENRVSSAVGTAQTASCGFLDVTRHDDPAEELPEQVKGDLRARGHVIRRDSQLDRELKKLPLSHAEEVEAWLRQMLARLGARDAGYEARYVIINEAANWMDKKLLAPLLEANGRDPGHSGPAGHLRSLLFDAKVDGELLRPERMALYHKYAKDRNNIKHNPGCEASTAVALGWLGMIGNRLLHDCCGTDEAIRERVRACLESGTASVVEPAAAVRIDPCKHFVGRRWLFDHLGSLLSPDADTLPPPAALLLAPGGWGKSAFMDELCVTGGLRLGAQYSVVAWHAIKHDELSSTYNPAALVQHLASVLEDRLVPYAKLRSRQDIRDLFDEKQLGNDGGWTSLLKGLLAPLADLKLEGEALERALGGQGRCVGVIVVDGLDEFPHAGGRFASLRPTFQVILAAMRPLTVSTLHQVARLSRETSLVEDSPDGFRAEVLDKIAGFVSLFGPAENPVVALQHESLASWLQSDTLRRSAGGYGWRKANGHTLLGAWMLCGMEATPEVVAGDREALDLSRTMLLRGVEGGHAADISCKDEIGMTALHYAAHQGHVEVVELLLRGVEGGSAADISCKGNIGSTALHRAALGGHAGVVELLLRGVEGGPAADISCKDKNGRTALHYPAQRGHAAVAKLLLRGVEGGPAVDISCKDEMLVRTALHCAAQGGHAAVVELLLRGVEGGPAADIC
eukprot:jgi/Tetstr1/446230/TSEL_033774.t1